MITAALGIVGAEMLEEVATSNGEVALLLRFACDAFSADYCPLEDSSSDLQRLATIGGQDEQPVANVKCCRLSIPHLPTSSLCWPSRSAFKRLDTSRQGEKPSHSPPPPRVVPLLTLSVLVPPAVGEANQRWAAANLTLHFREG